MQKFEEEEVYFKRFMTKPLFKISSENPVAKELIAMIKKSDLKLLSLS